MQPREWPRSGEFVFAGTNRRTSVGTQAPLARRQLYCARPYANESPVKVPTQTTSRARDALHTPNTAQSAACINHPNMRLGHCACSVPCWTCRSCSRSRVRVVLCLSRRAPKPIELCLCVVFAFNRFCPTAHLKSRPLCDTNETLDRDRFVA